MLLYLLFICILPLTLGRINGYQYRLGYSTSRIFNWEKEYQSWPLYSVGDLPSKPAELKVYFYQALVNLISPVNLLFYKISIVFDGGIKMFVNGNEVYTQFLPNDANDTTQPLRTDILGQQTIRLLPYYFFKGINLISIELHSLNPSDSDPFEISIDTEESTDSCINLMDPKMYGHTTSEGGETLPFAYDGNVNTKFNTSFLNSTNTMFFTEPYGFNKFILYTGDNCCNRDPNDFRIEGISKAADSYRVKKEMDNLKYLNNITFPGKLPKCNTVNSESRDDGKQPHTFQTENKKAYNGFIFRVLNSMSSISQNCPTGLHFSEIEMYSCKVKRCPSINNLPEAFVGTTISKPCQYGSDAITYKCSNDGIWIAEGTCPGKLKNKNRI